MEVLQIAPDQIRPYENNPRYNDHAVPAMVALLEEHGFWIPLLVRDVGGVWEQVDGHLRVKAALAMGMSEVPAIDVTGKTDAEIKAMRLAVNRAAELANWNVDALLEELETLSLPPEDMPNVVGMDDEYLRNLSPDALPELTQAPAPTGRSREQRADPDQVLSTDMVSLSLSMRLTDRDRMVELLDVLKERHNVNTRSAALLAELFPAPRTRRRTRNPNG